MINIHTHIKNEHPELSVPESVQPTESSDGDDYGPSQMSSESGTEYESAKKPLNFSAIGKHLSTVIRCPRGD